MQAQTGIACLHDARLYKKDSSVAKVDGHVTLQTWCPHGAASSLSPINSTSNMVTFGGLQAIGNAVMRLEVDEVELISGNWSNSGFTIPVCGAHPESTLSRHAWGNTACFGTVW